MNSRIHFPAPPVPLLDRLADRLGFLFCEMSFCLTGDRTSEAAGFRLLAGLADRIRPAWTTADYTRIGPRPGWPGRWDRIAGRLYRLGCGFYHVHRRRFDRRWRQQPDRPGPLARARRRLGFPIVRCAISAGALAAVAAVLWAYVPAAGAGLPVPGLFVLAAGLLLAGGVGPDPIRTGPDGDRWEMDPGAVLIVAGSVLMVAAVAVGLAYRDPQPVTVGAVAAVAYTAGRFRGAVRGSQ